MARPPTCHPNRTHEARGLCTSCYAREQYKRTGHIKRARLRAAYREDPEPFRQYIRAWRANLKASC